MNETDESMDLVFENPFDEEAFATEFEASWEQEADQYMSVNENLIDDFLDKVFGEFFELTMHNGWAVRNPVSVLAKRVKSDGRGDVSEQKAIELYSDVLSWSEKVFYGNSVISVGAFYNRTLNIALSIYAEYGLPDGTSLSEPLSKLVWDRLSEKIYMWLDPIGDYEL